MTALEGLLEVTLYAAIVAGVAFCITTEVAVQLGADRSRVFSFRNAFDDP